MSADAGVGLRSLDKLLAVGAVITIAHVDKDGRIPTGDMLPQTSTAAWLPQRCGPDSSRLGPMHTRSRSAN